MNLLLTHPLENKYQEESRKLQNTYSTIPYPINNDLVDHIGTYTSGYGPNTVGHAHQDAGISGSYVQMVHVESRDGETTECYANGEGCHPLGDGMRVGHDEEESRLHSKSLNMVVKWFIVNKEEW